MLRNYKHNFFGQGLLPVFSPEDREEGGGFYSVILKKQRVFNKGPDLAGEK